MPQESHRGKDKDTHKLSYRKISYYLSAVGGAILENTLHPLDTISKRLQNSDIKVSLNPNKLSQLRSTLSTIIYPVNNSSIMDGYVAALTYRSVQRTVMFGTQPIMQSYLHKHIGEPIGTLVGDKYKITVTHMLSGSIIGMSEIAFLFLDKWKILRQLEDKIKVIPLIRREKLNLFRGVFATGLRNAQAFSTLYGVDGLVKIHLFNLNPTDHVSFTQKLSSSLIGSIAAVIVTNPADVIKTRVQKNNVTNLEAIRQISAHAGYSGYLKGIWPRLFSVTPRLTIIKTASEQLAPMINAAIDKMMKTP